MYEYLQIMISFTCERCDVVYMEEKALNLGFPLIRRGRGDGGWGVPTLACLSSSYVALRGSGLFSSGGGEVHGLWE